LVNVPGHLNNQRGRELIVREVLSTLDVDAIVETGTFRGGSTRFFASQFNLPVYSVEINTQFFEYAKLSLRDLVNCTRRQGDSRSFLDSLSQESALHSKCIFFYLDAHWGYDLPLTEEIRIITKSWHRTIILIDDFQVPGDNGYAYDDYGPSKKLAISELPNLESVGLTAFFPDLPSHEETGARRGCVVLADNDSAQYLKKTPSLRLWP